MSSLNKDFFFFLCLLDLLLMAELLRERSRRNIKLFLLRLNGTLQLFACFVWYLSSTHTHRLRKQTTTNCDSWPLSKMTFSNVHIQNNNQFQAIICAVWKMSARIILVLPSFSSLYIGHKT